jgi:polar amino acid transport system substrate-binding protein
MEQPKLNSRSFASGTIAAMVGGYMLQCGVFLLLAAMSQRATYADALDEIHRRGTLTWGGDQEGGAPFVFPDPKDPQHLIGFEVDLADLLAGELGVKAQFHQGQWEQVPDMLGREIDVALNGFERTSKRVSEYLCTRPYYAFGLQLIVRRDCPIESWKQLKPGKPDGSPWRIGVLGQSEAEFRLNELQVDKYKIEAIIYNGNTDAMEDVESGRLDATIADDCVADYYVDRYKELKLVGWPIDGGYYVGLVARGEPRLLSALDAALKKLITDDRLKKLYDRWDLDGRSQMLMLRDAGETPPAEATPLGKILATNLPILLESAEMTVLLSVVSFPLAIAIGIGVAIGRLYGPWPIAKSLGLYVEVLRGTPLMLQLYAIYFLLPKFGLALPALVAGIMGLAINYSAYEY